MKVKICGLMRRVDAEGASALGADYLGVILSAGFGRSMEVVAARKVVEGLDAVAVAVLVDEEPEQAALLARALGAGVIQLHGHEPPEDVAALRALGAWRLWKAVRATSPADLDDVVARYGDLVDGFLVEGYRPGVVGGGGASLDRASVEAIRPRVPAALEVILAGGLTPDTVADAVNRYAPDVVDVSSGVESALGRKDPTLLETFITRARAASAALGPKPPSGDHR